MMKLRLFPCKRVSMGLCGERRQFLTRSYHGSPFSTTLVEAKKQKRNQDREFLISVLESSTTKRDAKAYLKTFGSAAATQVALDPGEAPHVALVKIRKPQAWDADVLDGVAKTLAKLGHLGLLSIVVVDCDVEHPGPGNFSDHRRLMDHEVNRLATAFSRYSDSGVKTVSSAIAKTPCAHVGSPIWSGSLSVELEDAITTPLLSGQLVIVPCLALQDANLQEVVDADDLVFTFVKFLSGLQSPDSGTTTPSPAPFPKAYVDRVIVIDPLGGIPARTKGHGASVFINLEDEFEVVKHNLERQTHTVKATRLDGTTGDEIKALVKKHVQNLKLANKALSVLPSTCSVLITSPAEAANIDVERPSTSQASLLSLAGEVGTRRKQNPLIHNFLTDRPVYSSSLPIGRIKPVYEAVARLMPTTTLAKRGLPVSIFPNPYLVPWQPPKPGSARLRLTDPCIDLARLVHLIDDSFGRTLDVERYLGRIQDSLAGVIIAGEYDGGAILTWERPFGMDEETAYETGRLVPYLDKFAVLKKSQGAGGVADIVFNAMARDCFPNGVCWRSRSTNPVNGWYFERSKGTRKLDHSNWTMFWTTPNAHMDHVTVRDYEHVCRHVVPTWKDEKSVVD